MHTGKNINFHYIMDKLYRGIHVILGLHNIYIERREGVIYNLIFKKGYKRKSLSIYFRCMEICVRD